MKCNSSKRRKHHLKRTVKQQKKQGHWSGGAVWIRIESALFYIFLFFIKSVLQQQHAENVVENCWNRRFIVSKFIVFFAPNHGGAHARKSNLIYMCFFSFFPFPSLKVGSAALRSGVFFFKSLTICFGDRFPEFTTAPFPFFHPKNRTNQIKTNILNKIRLLLRNLSRLPRLKTFRLSF